MPSTFASLITRPFQNKSLSKKTSCGRMSFSSDTSTLLNIDPSNSVPIINKVNQIVEAEALDLEDQAWGSPPPSDYNWLLPRFARRGVSQRSSSS
ncbi:hypothetical protein M413DRAFT_447894 [Hebeloma cylindrosporum]|uniref:Uncharacterized protein n=1 Tax=Hebeloma cylindrosporum TaxID=76867 RepID=A0A0C3C1N6_HEBCY|nr:hypothetical protein M413DRAFT_447894 [Hebeloma cylindrosporum h7]